MNIKAIFKSVIAGATIIGGAILGNEARKSFTKPVNDDIDDAELDAVETEDVTEEPAEEADGDDDPDEVPED